MSHSSFSDDESKPDIKSNHYRTMRYFRDQVSRDEYLRNKYRFLYGGAYKICDTKFIDGETQYNVRRIRYEDEEFMEKRQVPYIYEAYKGMNKLEKLRVVCTRLKYPSSNTKIFIPLLIRSRYIVADIIKGEGETEFIYAISGLYSHELGYEPLNVDDKKKLSVIFPVMNGQYPTILGPSYICTVNSDSFFVKEKLIKVDGETQIVPIEDNDREILIKNNIHCLAKCKHGTLYNSFYTPNCFECIEERQYLYHD